MRRLPVVDDPGRFLREELSRVQKALPHRLRGSGATAYLRHQSEDVERLLDAFLWATWDPPPGAAARVAELGDSPRVLDLGAGSGAFSLWALRHWPGAVVTSLEWDPLSLVMLRRSARATDRAEWSIVDGNREDPSALLASADLVKLEKPAGHLLSAVLRAHRPLTVARLAGDVARPLGASGYGHARRRVRGAPAVWAWPQT